MFSARLLVCCISIACSAAEPAMEMRLAVDAADLPATGLLKASMTIPARSSELAVRFPEWIPGTHAPSGPVQNLGGLAVRDDRGRPAHWERDPRNAFRFTIAVPTDATSITVDTVYIANQPSVNSRGIDVIGQRDLGLINWNCCVLVPEGVAPAQISCTVDLSMPPEWSWAGALGESKRVGDTLSFISLPLDRLIDSPVVIAKALDTFRLHAADERCPEVQLHVATSATARPWRDERWLTKLRRLPLEAAELFGGAWFERYDQLLLVGPYSIGLEHSDSSVNGIDPSTTDFGESSRHDRSLLAHEFTHSWVGKYRRPVGMLTGNYQTVPVLDSLWIYEGLTEHLGRVLAVRCGLIDPGEWRSEIAHDLATLAAKPGRRWRSLRDTCRSSAQLRGLRGRNADFRRGQDFYREGALFWLAADLRIRAATRRAHDLDDLCAAFFGPRGQQARGFDEHDLTTALDGICPDDWAGRIHRAVDETGDLDMSFLAGSGWRFSAEPARTGEVDPEDVEDGDLRTALGIVIQDGRVAEVVPDSPASRSGIRSGDFVYSANGVEMEKDPLALAKAALAAPERHEIALYACRGSNEWATRTIVTDGGVRVARLVRVEGESDALAAILAPRANRMPTIATPP